MHTWMQQVVLTFKILLDLSSVRLVSRPHDYDLIRVSQPFWIRVTGTNYRPQFLCPQAFQRRRKLSVIKTYAITLFNTVFFSNTFRKGDVHSVKAFCRSTALLTGWVWYTLHPHSSRTQQETTFRSSSSSTNMSYILWKVCTKAPVYHSFISPGNVMT